MNLCFKWCLVRYLHSSDHNPARIRKIDKLFGDELQFENIRFPVKIKNIHKIERKKKKNNSFGISVFSYERAKKSVHFIS